MCKKKIILIALFLCLAGSMTGFADVDVIVYENDFEDPCQVDALSGWNWGDNGTVHNVVYADYEGNMVVEHTGTIDNSAGTADISTRFGSKWGMELSGNTSTNPADYTIEFDLRNLSGDWDPIGLEFFVLPGDQGYGSGISEYAQADGWVHVSANLADLSVGWWAGQAWDMTLPAWQIELGGPAWPGVSVPAGTPAWDQIWLMDNLKITMISKPVGTGAGNLVAYYPMENDVNDATGNGHDGVFMGDPNAGDPNFVEGLVCNGMALDLDGVNDYVDCGYDPVFDFTSEMTVSAWVTIRSIPTAWTAAVAKGEYAWRLGNVNMDPRFHFGITIWNAPDTASIDATTAVGYDEWHHIAGVFDGANINLYLDGELDGSAPTTEPIGVNDKNVFIGNNPDATDRYWDGLVDEVKIFGKALSNDEVRYLAGYRSVPADPSVDNLVAYYPLENNADDASGNELHGVFMGDPNTGEPNYVEGQVGMALDLDGVDDYMDCGYDPLFDVTTNEITVSAWVTIGSNANQWAAIAAKGEYAWRLGNASWDPRFHFGITIWSAPDTASIDGVTAVAYDEWHHVAGVFDGANIMVYLDGALDVSAATTEPIGVNDKNMLIGNNPDDPVRYWDGLVDELKIYDRALSECELLYLAERPCIPVHSYTFEDGTANDSVGSADGTLVGGAVVADGALLTTAQDQWMEMPGDVIDINSFDAVTIEAWYTPTAGANTGWSMLAYLGGSSEPNIAGVGINGYFMTTARADDKSRAAISTGSNEPWADETGADGVEYDDGMLHHMVSTLDADEITLYIDGVLQARTPMDAHNSISDLDNDYALLAKGGYGGDPEWIGQIHEFNIYDCVLSPAEVADKYAAGLDE